MALLLAMLGQTVGWPVPEGGAGEAHRRAGPAAGVARWGRCAAPPRSSASTPARIGSAAYVSPTGARVTASTVIADVLATALYGGLVPASEALPTRTVRSLRRFALPPRHGQGRLGAVRSGAVGGDIVGAPGRCTSPTAWTRCQHRMLQIGDGVVPEQPFLLVGQMTTTDPTRSPTGTESMWAYTHVPHGVAWEARRAGALRGPDGVAHRGPRAGVRGERAPAG